MPKKAFYETEEFQKLKAEWDQKLEESKFVDIEKNDTETMIQPEVFNQFKRRYNGSANYSDLCQAILRSYQFKKPWHKTIFELHAEGKSCREIENWFETNLDRKVDHSTVGRIVERIKRDFNKA